MIGASSDHQKALFGATSRDIRQILLNSAEPLSKGSTAWAYLRIDFYGT